MAKKKSGNAAIIPPPSQVPRIVKWLLDSADYLGRDKTHKELWNAKFDLLKDIKKGKEVRGRLLGIVKGEDERWHYWDDPLKDLLINYIVNGGEDPFAQAEPRVIPEGVSEEARNLLKDPALLWRISEAIRKQGLAGERKSAMVTYLTATTRLMHEAASETVKATSAAGKNWMIMIVLSLMPPEDIVKGERLTPQSLYHFPEDGLKHKILTITEMKGMKDSQSSVRWLISEGELILLIPIKDPATGDFITKEKRVRGPTAVLSSTTKSKLQEDDETRNLSVFIDESEAQTRRILHMQASMYDGFKPLPPEKVEVFREVQRQLRENMGRRVCIPYADFLAESFPAEKMRPRRDFPRLLLLIATIAFIHQYQRPRDREGRIVAQPADYFYARSLIEDFLSRTMYSLPPQSDSILVTAEDHYAASDEDGGFTGPTFTRSDISKKMKAHPGWVRKWIVPLEDVYLEVLQGGQGKAYQYRLLDTPREKLRLPSWEDVKGYLPGGGELRTASHELQTGNHAKLPAGSESGTSHGSNGWVKCVFDPTKEDPRCPHCGNTPPCEVCEVDSCLDSQITSDGASSEAHAKSSEDRAPEGGAQ